MTRLTSCTASSRWPPNGRPSTICQLSVMVSPENPGSRPAPGQPRPAPGQPRPAPGQALTRDDGARTTAWGHLCTLAIRPLKNTSTVSKAMLKLAGHVEYGDHLDRPDPHHEFAGDGVAAPELLRPLGSHVARRYGCRRRGRVGRLLGQLGHSLDLDKAVRR